MYFGGFQIRAEILQSLGKFKETTLDQVKLMSSSVDVITEIPGEVNTGAQVLIVEGKDTEKSKGNFWN